jgi:hypothetical protein
VTEESDFEPWIVMPCWNKRYRYIYIILQRRRRTTVVVSRGTYQNGVPYLRNHGRDPLADDVVVGRPAPERGGQVVLADVDEVEGVPKSMDVDRGTLTCTTPTKMRDYCAAPWM